MVHFPANHVWLAEGKWVRWVRWILYNRFFFLKHEQFPTQEEVGHHCQDDPWIPKPCRLITWRSKLPSSIAGGLSHPRWLDGEMCSSHPFESGQRSNDATIRLLAMETFGQGDTSCSFDAGLLLLTDSVVTPIKPLYTRTASKSLVYHWFGRFKHLKPFSKLDTNFSVGGFNMFQCVSTPAKIWSWVLRSSQV